MVECHKSRGVSPTANLKDSRMTVVGAWGEKTWEVECDFRGVKSSRDRAQLCECTHCHGTLA